MAKGGARTRSGPPPDPNALARKRDEADWTKLPAEGRPGRAPRWPLTQASPRERTLWTELWKLPQAVMWERQHLHHTVALYVRRLAEAEMPESKVTVSTLVRQLADGLGLTSPGLRSLRWRIESPAKKTAAKKARRASARDRLKVVDGAG